MPLPENSRRLKALPVWFSLIAYGKDGIKSIVENNIKLTRLFGEFIEHNISFELLAPVRSNTVCFTLSGTDDKEKINAFLKNWMTPDKFL